MTAALLEAPPAACRGAPARRRPGEPVVTLEERLQAAWRVVQRGEVVECPVCRAGMCRDGPSARCGGCGSVLA